MTILRSVVVILLTLLWPLACYGGPNTDAVINEVPPVVSVSTFNVGLAPGSVPLSTLRVKAVAEAIAKEPFDVMCIQEAWTPESRRELKKALNLPAGQFFHEDTAGRNEIGRDWCRAGEIDLPLACVKSHCGGVAEDQMAACAKLNCRAELFATYFRNPGCVYCLVASTGLSAEDTYKQCTKAPGASNIYGGNNGVVLVSRIPLDRKEVLVLPSSMSNRVALLARIKPPGASEPIEVACMHVSASAPMPPTSGFISWQAEKLEQVMLVSNRLKERAEGAPSLLIGDLNAGPSASGLEGTAEDLYSWIVAQKFIEPVISLGMQFCTACRTSTFRSLSEKDRLIDHVMLRDPRGRMSMRPLAASQILGQTVLVSDRLGCITQTNLSDHFGVNVIFGFED